MGIHRFVKVDGSIFERVQHIDHLTGRHQMDRHWLLPNKGAEGLHERPKQHVTVGRRCAVRVQLDEGPIWSARNLGAWRSQSRQRSGVGGLAMVRSLFSSGAAGPFAPRPVQRGHSVHQQQMIFGLTAGRQAAGLEWHRAPRSEDRLCLACRDRIHTARLCRAGAEGKEFRRCSLLSSAPQSPPAPRSACPADGSWPAPSRRG